MKGEELELVREIVAKQNDIYLRELQSELKDKREIEVSISSLCRTLKREKLVLAQKNVSRQ